MESPVKRKPHEPKHEKTRSITYRLPAKLVEELETEANQKEISQNVLVKQILEKYTQWDKFADVMGMIPIPKDIDRKSTRLNSSHIQKSRMPSSA